MDSIFDNIELGFSDAVNRLREWAGRFSAVYQQFVAIPAQYRSESWQSVKNQADNVRATIQMFTSAIDTAYRWLQSSFGLSGLGQLGLVIPAVPWLTVAAVGGAISAIMLSYSYMVEELNKSAYRKELMDADAERVKQGLEPLYFKELTARDNVFTDATSMLKWVVIGATAIFVVPKILEKMKGR